ncbi:MAG: hypothetical protein KF830_07165 [Planctomycetes bacterium]|nr:hypothetical protein [Planctomycetota bacterium]
MKTLLLQSALGGLLFTGALVGGLAATGRLNHEGTANIPLLNALFPAPAAVDAGGTPGDAAVHEATHAGGPGVAQDAASSPAAAAAATDPPTRRKTGRSLFAADPPAGDGHGDGHAAAGPGDGHGAAAPAPSTARAHAQPPPAAPAGEQAVQRDLQRIAQDLAGDRHAKYAPGGFFRFEGMPAGLSPDQINEAWQRVQGVVAELDRRKVALDLREQELQELADDVSRRQAELGAERNKIDQRHRELDARIQKFQAQVKLVRNDEVAALKRNAQTLAAFEVAKAAEIVLDQWKTEQGQDEILKVLEFMDKDKVNELLAELPNAMVQDLLKKRMRIGKESASPGGSG